MQIGEIEIIYIMVFRELIRFRASCMSLLAMHGDSGTAASFVNRPEYRCSLIDSRQAHM